MIHQNQNPKFRFLPSLICILPLFFCECGMYLLSENHLAENAQTANPLLVAALAAGGPSSGGGVTVPGGGTATPIPTFTVNGTLTGLYSTQIQIALNGAETIGLAGNGAFSFTGAILDKTSYTVSIQSQPSDVVCVVSNGFGTMGGANITNVSITCPMAIKSGVIWMRCAQGQTWNGTLNGNLGGCQGAAAHLRWCTSPTLPSPQNRCNGNVSGSDTILSPPYFGDATSDVYPSCDGLNSSASGYGLTGWKAPHINNLTTLREGTSSPFIDQVAFPNIDLNRVYWSSISASLDNVYAVDFFSGTLTQAQKQVSDNLRCATGGQ